MSQARLSTLTLNTVDHVRSAAEHTLSAWRGGSMSLIDLLEDGMQQAARRGAKPLVPAVADMVERGTDRVSRIARDGVVAAHRRTGRAIVASSSAAQRQVKRLAMMADGVDNKVLARSLQMAAQASLPGARLAEVVTHRVADGARVLAERLDGKALAQAKRSATSARRSAAAAGRRSRKQADDVVTEATAAVRQAATSARKAGSRAAASTRKATAKAVEQAAEVVEQGAAEVRSAARKARRAATPKAATASKAAKASAAAEAAA